MAVTFHHIGLALDFSYSIRAIAWIYLSMTACMHIHSSHDYSQYILSSRTIVISYPHGIVTAWQICNLMNPINAVYSYIATV